MSDEKSRDEIWDDGLHFTEYGYGVMGAHIAKQLVDLVAEGPRQTKLEAKVVLPEDGNVAKGA